MRDPEDAEVHDVTLAVWDLGSPLVVGRYTTVKVGAKCSRSCDLGGSTVEIIDEMGVAAGVGMLGTTPWPGTSALYWTEVDLAAPAAQGHYSWTFNTAATAAEPRHAGTSYRVHVMAVGPPEHSVAVKTTRRDTEASLEDVQVRVGAFKVATDRTGLATIELPAGTYEVAAWKAGYEIASRQVEIAGSMQIDLALDPAPEPEEEYWM